MSESVKIIADGGIRGKNPGGFGYGSFVIPRTDGVYAQRERLIYGHDWEGFAMTNIVAECLTCIRAVQWLKERSPRPRRVTVMNDCRWVGGHLMSHKGKSKKDHLRRLHREWKEAIAGFEQVVIVWHSRVYSVEALGH